ncbi:MAG: deoxyribonuclease V [Geminicoccaceae bacterium]
MPLTPVHEHPWNLTPAGARALQDRLSGEAELRDHLGPIALVAGIDVGFENGRSVTRAAVAVLHQGDLQLVESSLARRATGFPYVPGLLSFREIPAVLDALASLRCVPDLLICDGQGLAHPRRFGLACHLGWLLETPSVGVAKSRLLGEFAEPPAARGAWTPLVDRGEVVGAAVRTRRGVKPVFVSPGHRVDVASAVRLALACTDRYRLPEPSRAAHRLASGG